jgi:uncharacterized protein (DUF849 family)
VSGRYARVGFAQHGHAHAADGGFAGKPFSNLTKDIEAWAAKMKELCIKPEMECYSQAMYRDVSNSIKKDLLKPLLREHGLGHAVSGRG